MDKTLFKIEKWIFYVLIFFLFLQTRHLWQAFGREFNEWTSLYVYATDILLLAILALWFRRIFKGESKIKFNREGTVLIVFLVFVGFSILAAGNKILGLYNLAKLFEFSLLFLYLKNNFSQLFDLERFWQIFISSAAFGSIFAIWQFFKQSSLGLKIFNESPTNSGLAGVAKIVVNGAKIVRAYGLVPHPNILAAFLVVAIFGLVFLFLRNYGKLSVFKGIIFVGVFCLLSLALFLTFSRAVTLAGLGILILGLALLFWRQPKYKKPVVISFIALLAVNCLLLAVFWPYISARYDAGSIAGSQSLNLRFFYAKIALDYISGYPLFGVGAGNFVFSICQYSFIQNWMCQPVHNIYLLVAAEIGLLGFFVFIYFLFLILANAYLFFKKESDKLEISHLLLAICFLLFIGLFDHFLWTLQQGQLMLWMMLGILSSLSVKGLAEKSL